MNLVLQQIRLLFLVLTNNVLVNRATALYEQHVEPRWQRFAKNAHVAAVLDFGARYMHTYARLLVCCYFANHAWTTFSYYWFYRVPGVPWLALLAMPCAAMVALNRLVPVFGTLLVLIASKDALLICYHQFYEWWYVGRELYINELMVKRFSMVGAMLLVLVNDPTFKERLNRTQKALEGLIVADEPKYKVTSRMSVVLLVVRLLISSLFLFVGWGEIKRQLMWSHGVKHGSHTHMRPEGDGHNQMLFKLAEFALALPFVIGFKTSFVSRLLAVALFLEAMIYWRFWATLLGIWYSIHAREHCFVNLGVAGGLLFLGSFEAAAGGVYSIDELLKKKGE